MKKLSTILAVAMLIMAGCIGSKQSSEDLIVVDVTKSYPDKELILQDFMDVEYVALETNEEFVCQGFVHAVGKNVIIVTNKNHDCDIFVFDRNGKGLRKFNRKGGGPEEYSSIIGLTLDENNGELFVNDWSKILVYDLFGNFKRSFNHSVDNQDFLMSNKIYTLDRENLFHISFDAEGRQLTSIISKQDGSIVKNFEILYKDVKSLISNEMVGQFFISALYDYNSIIKHQNSWILTVSSSDTIYNVLPDYSMIPLILRTPSIQSMEPEIFLFPNLVTEQYYFMENIKIENGFQKTDLIYDRQDKKIYKYTLKNLDFSSNLQVDMKPQRIDFSQDVDFWQTIEAIDLFEEYKEGKLNGRLKEIASELKEEDNPVIMLVKHKK